jgi:hypothetical protein
MENMKYIEAKSQIPTGPHYAALVFESISIPGDQRSIDCPGHGYPTHTESVVQYIVFASRTEMESWVNREETSIYRKDNYCIVDVKPMSVKLTAKVE